MGSVCERKKKKKAKHSTINVRCYLLKDNGANFKRSVTFNTDKAFLTEDHIGLFSKAITLLLMTLVWTHAILVPDIHQKILYF